MSRPDAKTTVAFGRGWLGLKYLAIGVALSLIGVMAILGVQDRPPAQASRRLFAIVAAWGAASLGLFITLREIYRLARPGPPLLTLSPQGATLNIDGRNFVTIPWSKVKDLRTVNLTTRAVMPYATDLGDTRRYQTEVRETFRDVVALLIPLDFYESAIAPAYRGMRERRGLRSALAFDNGMVDHIPARSGIGPGWSSIFIRDGDDMLVALHHSMLPASAADLSAEVEARWRVYAAAAGR